VSSGATALRDAFVVTLICLPPVCLLRRDSEREAHTTLRALYVVTHARYEEEKRAARCALRRKRCSRARECAREVARENARARSEVIDGSAAR